MSVLSVQSVSYSYKTKYQTVQAVKDVSCDLSAGTFYALVGKSGSGKTTLLSLLAGLDTPQSGDIIVGGQSLREIDVDIYRRKQASVIYQSYNLFPLMTVCENVMYPLKLLRHSDADAKKEAQIALEKALPVRPDLKRGICGEHGGDPDSVKFCHRIGLQYVSCSPFRVPQARLAAAQAVVEERG